MTVLGFGATATIGSLRYTGGIAAVHITLATGPGVGSARLQLPRDLRVDAAPGDDVAISLAGESGEPTDAFTGTVIAVRRALDGTTLLCGDAAGALGTIRTGSTFEQQNAAAVVTALAREAGVGTGRVDLDVELPSYVADQARTAWEHVSLLAEWGGALATVSADGSVEIAPFPSPPADLALRYGREIAELGVTAARPTANLVLVGHGPAGSGSDPRALLQTTATLPDGAPGPDAGTIRLARPALRTAAAANRAGQAYADHNGSPRLRAACWLLPQLRAGTAVEIADAPTEGTAGPWLVTRVSHRVGAGPAGRTTFDAIGLASAGGAGLFDQLAGVVGSLL